MVSRLTILERIGLLTGMALFAVSFVPFVRNTGTLSNIAVGFGISILCAVCGSLHKDWRWRIIVRKYGLDPNVRVYVRRSASNYMQLLQESSGAEQIDIMGISLSYFHEYFCDNPHEMLRKLKAPMRILLPGDTGICDARDRTQGSPIGSLQQILRDTLTMLDKLSCDYPTLFNIRLFDIQPYFAYVRIDNEIWVTLYTTKTGRNCPVLQIQKKSSPELFDCYADHFEAVWNASPEWQKTTKSATPAVKP